MVTLVTSLYLGRLMRQTLRQANDNAAVVAQQVDDACGNALKEAAERDQAPASLETGPICASMHAGPSTIAAPSTR